MNVSSFRWSLVRNQKVWKGKILEVELEGRSSGELEAPLQNLPLQNFQAYTPPELPLQNFQAYTPPEISAPELSGLHPSRTFPFQNFQADTPSRTFPSKTFRPTSEAKLRLARTLQSLKDHLGPSNVPHHLANQNWPWTACRWSNHIVALALACAERWGDLLQLTSCELGKQSRRHPHTAEEPLWWEITTPPSARRCLSSNSSAHAWMPLAVKHASPASALWSTKSTSAKQRGGFRWKSRGAKLITFWASLAAKDVTFFWKSVGPGRDAYWNVTTGARRIFSTACVFLLLFCFITTLTFFPLLRFQNSQQQLCSCRALRSVWSQTLALCTCCARIFSICLIWSCYRTLVLLQPLLAIQVRRTVAHLCPHCVQCGMTKYASVRFCSLKLQVVPLPNSSAKPPQKPIYGPTRRHGVWK